jgi:hypothetical protein
VMVATPWQRAAEARRRVSGLGRQTPTASGWLHGITPDHLAFIEYGPVTPPSIMSITN